MSVGNLAFEVLCIVLYFALAFATSQKFANFLALIFFNKRLSVRQIGHIDPLVFIQWAPVHETLYFFPALALIVSPKSPWPFPLIHPRIYVTVAV